MKFIYWIFLILNIFVGIGLVYVIAIQESKNEGLQGQIGTSMQSSFKGLAGREEKLNLLARNLGIAFMVLCAVVAFATNRWGP